MTETKSAGRRNWKRDIEAQAALVAQSKDPDQRKRLVGEETDLWSEAMDNGVGPVDISRWAGQTNHVSVTSRVEAHRMRRYPAQYTLPSGVALSRSEMFLLGALGRWLERHAPGFDLENGGDLARWALKSYREVYEGGSKKSVGAVFTEDGAILTTVSLVHRRWWSGYVSDGKINGLVDASADSCVAFATRELNKRAAWVKLHDISSKVFRAEEMPAVEEMVARMGI